MEIPAGFVKVYDSAEPGSTPAGMTAQNSASFVGPPQSYPTAPFYWGFTDPVWSRDSNVEKVEYGDGAGAATYGRATGASCTLRHTNPSPPDWAYMDENIFEDCLVEAEFTGIQPGAAVVLEFSTATSETPPFANKGSGSPPFRDTASTLTVRIEYKPDGNWGIYGVEYWEPY